MELGKRLRQARLEAGLTQKQLCGDTITRNMLSQIENGTATPSMGTLRILAERLHKPLGYFLDGQSVVLPNQGVMESARRSYLAGEFAAAAEILADYQAPDGVYDPEKHLLAALVNMALAEKAMKAGKNPYAARLLQEAAREGEQTPYYTRELETRRILLLSKTGQEKPAELVQRLPELEEILILKARGALENGDFARCGRLLDAAENQGSPLWQFLRGQVCCGLKQYRDAIALLTAAEAVYPEPAAPLLEICYRELGDFQSAYRYACKQKANRNTTL